MFNTKTYIDGIIYFFAEKPRGIDFARNVYPYGADSDNVWYERTSTKHIRQMFSLFPDKNMPVLDLGCGKGYLLYRLHKMGFAHVDGIEYNEEIAHIARQNMDRLGIADGVRILNADARDFKNFDPYQIIYMFHPFKENVMKEVLRHVEESLIRRPRRFTAVYFYPVMYYLWDRSPMFDRARQMTLLFTNTTLEVFYYDFDPAWEIKSNGLRFKDILKQEMEGPA